MQARSTPPKPSSVATKRDEAFIGGGLNKGITSAASVPTSLTVYDATDGRGSDDITSPLNAGTGHDPIRDTGR